MAITVLLLWQIGSLALWDPDEGRYAEVGREMFASGDWLVPRLFAVPYLEKPPLLYWMVTASYHIFGPSEFAARLVPALCAGLGLFATGFFGRRVFRSHVGTYSILILSTSVLYFILARVVITDMLFSVALSSALIAFFLAQHDLIDERAGFFLFWICSAAATLAKGPVGPVLCLGIIVTDALLRRSVDVLLRPAVWIGLPFYLAIVLPWFVLIQNRYPEFLNFYIFKEHLQRAGGAEHPEPFYWFAPRLLVGCLPWTPLIFAAIPAWFSEARGTTTRAAAVRFLLVWVTIVFTLFSLSSGKLAPYILPMFPPLALLIAIFLDSTSDEATVLTPGRRRAFAVTSIFFVGLLVLLLVEGRHYRLRLAFITWFTLIAPLALGAIMTYSCRAERGPRPVIAIAASAGIFYMSLVTLGPQMSDLFTARPLAQMAMRLLRAGDEVVMINCYYPSALFYFGTSRTEGSSEFKGIPLLVGDTGELTFGAQLTGNKSRLISDIRELKQRMHGRRLICIAASDRKWDAELRKNLAEFKLVRQNRKAALLIGQPSSLPMSERAKGTID